FLITKASAGRGVSAGDRVWVSDDRKLKKFYYVLLTSHVLYLCYYIGGGSALDIARAAFGRVGAKEIVELRSETTYGGVSNATFVLYNVSYLLAAIRVSVWGAGRNTWLHIAYLAFCVCLFFHKSP